MSAGNAEQEGSKQAVPGGFGSWQSFWAAQGMPWRTEPEIEETRRRYLDDRRTIKPDFTHGIYPFKDIQLDRADVEWLLATHDGGRWLTSGSRASELVDLSLRQGIDVRGADLRGADLRRLPLAQLIGGLELDDWNASSVAHREAAAVHLEGANLSQANLRWAILRGAHLEGSNLRYAILEDATLFQAHLEGRGLSEEEAHDGWQHVSRGKALPPANLRQVRLNSGSNIAATLGNHRYGYVQLADVVWGNVNLARVDWLHIGMLGDERLARQPWTDRGIRKDRASRQDEYAAAVRANRQVAIVLRGQGLSEHADRFAYKARILQREVLRRRHRYLRYAGSLLLSLLAGYGYRPLRTLFWYLAIIFGFALAYVHFGHINGQPFELDEALVFSVTSFHGRGFFPASLSLKDLVTKLAAAEAVLGLLIEVSFIATFTQRYFGN